MYQLMISSIGKLHIHLVGIESMIHDLTLGAITDRSGLG